MGEASVSLRKGEAAIAVLLCALGLYVSWTSLEMPAGTFATPGPGLFPRSLGLLLAVSSAAILVHRSENRSIVGLSFGGIAPCFGVLVIAALLFMPLGAVASLALLAGLLSRLIGRVAWPKAVLFGAGMGAFVWLIFIQLLGVQLPPFPFAL